MVTKNNKEITKLNALIGQRIRTHRQALNLTLNQLAVKTGLSASRIGNWEQGTRTPTIESLIQLATHLQTTPGQLISENHLPESDHSFNDDYSLVPRYTVQASAGSGCEVISEQIVDHLAFRSDWLIQQMGLDTDQLALITVKGDSMEPTLFDGDLVLIDQRVHQPKESAIYAIAIDNAVWVKRLQLHVDCTLSIISDNKSQYPTEHIDSLQAKSLRIIGRVVWSAHRLA